MKNQIPFQEADSGGDAFWIANNKGRIVIEIPANWNGMNRASQVKMADFVLQACNQHGRMLSLLTQFAAASPGKPAPARLIAAAKEVIAQAQL